MAESVLNLAVLPRPLIERRDRASQILSKGAQDLKSSYPSRTNQAGWTWIN